MTRQSIDNWFCFFLIIIILAALSGCSGEQQSAKEISFSERYSLISMNEMIRLTYPENLPQKTTITLYLENLSNNYLYFPVDMNIELLVYSDDGQWIEVKNITDYYGNPTILSPRGNGMGWDNLISFLPDLSDIEMPVQLRVVVIGNLYENGYTTEEKVGAYLDIEVDR